MALFRARGATDLSLDDVIGTIVDRTWGAPASTDMHLQSLRRTVQRVVLNTMLDRAGDAVGGLEVVLVRPQRDAARGVVFDDRRAGFLGEVEHHAESGVQVVAATLEGVRQSDCVLHGELGARSDAEVRGVGGVAE